MHKRNDICIRRVGGLLMSASCLHKRGWGGGGLMMSAYEGVQCLIREVQ